MTGYIWWLIVFGVIGILKELGIVRLDFLDAWLTSTNVLLGIIIIITFHILVNLEKINLRAIEEKEKAELKERLSGFNPEETSTKEQYTPYGRSISDISQEEDNNSSEEDETIKDEERERITRERLAKLGKDWWKKKL